jgi:hypothetical protein
MRTGVAAIRRADAANSGPRCNIRDRGPFITVAATRAGGDSRVWPRARGFVGLATSHA